MEHTNNNNDNEKLYHVCTFDSIENLELFACCVLYQTEQYYYDNNYKGT